MHLKALAMFLEKNAFIRQQIAFVVIRIRPGGQKGTEILVSSSVHDCIMYHIHHPRPPFTTLATFVINSTCVQHYRGGSSCSRLFDKLGKNVSP